MHDRSTSIRGRRGLPTPLTIIHHSLLTLTPVIPPFYGIHLLFNHTSPRPCPTSHILLLRPKLQRSFNPPSRPLFFVCSFSAQQQLLLNRPNRRSPFDDYSLRPGAHLISSSSTASNFQPRTAAETPTTAAPSTPPYFDFTYNNTYEYNTTYNTDRKDILDVHLETLIGSIESTSIIAPWCETETREAAAS